MLKNKKLQKFLLVLKILVTLILSIFIISKVDWQNVQQTLVKANPWLLLLVFICMFMNIVLCAYKWKILLENHNVQIGLYQLARYYFTAMFFSNFLPSTIGGDAYRIYKIYTIEKSKSASVLPVFIERCVGVAALLFIGSIGAFGSFLHTKDDMSLLGLVFGSSLFCVTLFSYFLLQSKKVKELIQNHKRIPGKIKMAVAHLDLYKFNNSNMVFFVILSVLFYVFLVFYRLFIIQSFGENCSFFSLSMIIMMSNMIASLPISINGIGLMDGSFVFLISRYHVNYDTAVMVMIVQRLISTMLSLLGGLTYFFDKENLQVDISKDKDPSFS